MLETAIQTHSWDNKQHNDKLKTRKFKWQYRNKSRKVTKICSKLQRVFQEICMYVTCLNRLTRYSTTDRQTNKREVIPMCQSADMTVFKNFVNASLTEYVSCSLSSVVMYLFIIGNLRWSSTQCAFTGIFVQVTRSWCPWISIRLCLTLWKMKNEILPIWIWRLNSSVLSLCQYCTSQHIGLTT